MPKRPRLDPAKEQEYREEAERLALASREDQAAAITLHSSVADNPKVPKRDREEARQRAEALERHLRRLARRKGK